MSIMILQVFISLVLVGGSILLLAISIKQNDHEHADRLSLLPFEEDEPKAAATATREDNE